MNIADRMRQLLLNIALRAAGDMVRLRAMHHHQIPTFLVMHVGNDDLSLAAGVYHGRRSFMSATLSVGHKLQLAISFLDQHGNPMLQAPTVDSPPAWANTTPATETLQASGDGLSAVATPVAPGSDSVSVTALIGGQQFTASLDVVVTPEPQVLTSIAIAPTIV